MKKLITYGIAALAIGILFSSCMSNMTLTKRHYTKGYYIDYAKNVPNRLVSNKETKVVMAKPTAPFSTIQPIVKQNKAVVYSNNRTSRIVLTPGDKRTEHATIVKGIIASSAQQKIEIIDRFKEQSIYAPSAALSISDDSPHRQGLSLFWLVILIVLILWALGVLVGGIGSIIYLLLVVALILLILWLLRIV